MSEQRVIRDHKGRAYPTIAAMCRAWGVSRPAYLWRIKQGWGMEAALTCGSHKQSRKHWKDHEGNSYPTCEKMCEAWAFGTADAYRRRINLGWDERDALTKPVRAVSR